MTVWVIVFLFERGGGGGGCIRCQGTGDRVFLKKKKKINKNKKKTNKNKNKTN
jgi:hypothetical protein